MNQEGILFQFAFGELINSYMALFLAGRRVETKDEQDWEKLFPRRQELITPDNIFPALMVWDLYLEEIEPDLGSLHLYAFQLRFKASLANFPGLNWSNSLPLADTISMAFSCLWFAFVNTLNYNKKKCYQIKLIYWFYYIFSKFFLIVFNRLLKSTTAVEFGL